MAIHQGLLPVLLLASTVTACASAAPAVTPDEALSLGQVLTLRDQSRTDQALIEQLEGRSLAFALTDDDQKQLRANGVSEVLLAYLQGRSTGRRDANRPGGYASAPRAWVDPRYLPGPYTPYGYSGSQCYAPYVPSYYYGSRYSYGPHHSYGVHGGHHAGHHGGHH